MFKLLCDQEKPSWFSYPPQFMRIVEQNLVYLDPWRVLEGEELRKKYEGIKERYPDREFVPFAKRDDSDDVAGWEKGVPGKVVILHDYASPEWEERETLDSFWHWLRKAIEDTISIEP